MILEGIVTTRNLDGSTNVAPMGPIVDAGMTHLTLRPFQTSTTYQNLKRTGCGILHVTDDVLLLAQAALERFGVLPAMMPAQQIDGSVLADACRWYEFQVASIDDSAERTVIEADVVHTGRIRDFFGFNRAKHAVLEAAILATRLHLLPPDDVRRQLSALRSPVEKTAGPEEREAFTLIEQYVVDYERGKTNREESGTANRAEENTADER
ncbi:MAG: DUF447 family protein [Planctomycetaceae bacterium]|nr:DUF447 family protein [Planctomycetaceae bacterium]